MTAQDDAPLVGVVGGSRSDFPVLEEAVAVLMELGVPAELRVVSAHRTPDLLFRYAEDAAVRGIRVIVAGAGGAAHLPGMLAAKTTLPVIGVPIPTQHLGWPGLAAVDRPDATRGPGRDGRHRQRRECRAARGSDPGSRRRGARDPTGRLAVPADRGRDGRPSNAKG